MRPVQTSIRRRSPRVQMHQLYGVAISLMSITPSTPQATAQSLIAISRLVFRSFLKPFW